MANQFVKGLRIQGYDMSAGTGRSLTATWTSPAVANSVETVLSTVRLAPTDLNNWFTPTGGDMVLRNRSAGWVTCQVKNTANVSFQYPIPPQGLCFLASDASQITAVTPGNVWDASAQIPGTGDITLEFMGANATLVAGSAAPAANTVYVWQNAAISPWTENSYSSGFRTVADSRTSPAGVAIEGNLLQFGAFNFQDTLAPLVQSYSAFQFDAKCATPGTSIRVQLDAGNVNTPSVYIDMPITSASWLTYTVPFNGTGVVNTANSTTTFTNYRLANINPPTLPNIDINNIGLIPVAPSGGGSGGGGGGGTTPTSSYYIWQNGVRNSWVEQSYGIGSSYVTDSRITGGQSVEGAAPQFQAWNWYFGGSGSVPVNNYLSLSFDAKASATGGTLRAQLDPGSSSSPIVSQSFAIGTAWTTYTMTFANPAASNSATTTSTFTNVELINLAASATPTIDVNNVYLTVNPNPPVATYSLVPKDNSPALVLSGTPGLLHTTGNKFYDGSNAVWMGRGMNCPDTRLDGKAYTNTQTTVATELKRRMAWAQGQGVDFFRILMDMRNSADDVVNNADYLAALKDVVSYAGSIGCRVLLSLWNDYTAVPFGGGQSGQPTIATLTHLSQIVTSFRNSTHVMFGFCNEPRGNEDAQSQAAYLSIANQCISVVRQVEARDGGVPHICVVQGVSHYSRHLRYFITNPATDTTYPVTPTSTSYLAYESHCYEAAADWPSQPYNDGVPGPGSMPFPIILGEAGANAQSLGGTAIVSSSVDDLTPMLNACQTNSYPYCVWTLDYNSPPDLLATPTSSTGYGAGITLQWTNPYGLKAINIIRSQKGLGNVDINGNPA